MHPTEPFAPLAPDAPVLLVSAHGSPDTLDELPAFLTNIRRGRPAPPAVLDEVRRRYERIGGASPLREVTEAQAATLGASLRMPAYVAMRLWRPYPRDVLAALYERGARRFVSVPIAPFSTAIYHAAVREAARALPGPVQLYEVAGYGAHERLVRAWSELLSSALLRTFAPGLRVQVLFTAHSLPTAVLARGDRYAQLVEACVAAVVGATPRLATGSVAHRLVYQSQGMTDDEWLGPDLRAALRDARAQGFDGVLVVPVGFPSEHIEVRYDLDVEARGWADEEGLRFARTETLGTHAGLLAALGDAVRDALARGPVALDEAAPGARPMQKG